MSAMYGFHAGMMRDRIRIRRAVQTENDGGGLDIGWQTVVDDLPAQVLSLNGREAVIGNVLQGVSLFQITIRYRTDIRTADQILWSVDPVSGEPRELNIINAEDQEGKQRWTIIQASTQTPQGA